MLRAEEQDEHEERQPGDHTAVRGEAHEGGQVTVLEHPGDHAVRGRGGQQVQGDRDQRDGEGAERPRQQQERQQQDEGEDQRGPGRELDREVVRGRGAAAHSVLDAGQVVERGGKDGGAQGFQGLVRRRVGAAAR